MRQQFTQRTIRLAGPAQLETALAMLRNAPLDSGQPLELILREEKKLRGMDQNSAMWAGPLRDIAQQGWVGGRQYIDKVWHEHFKELFLPEDDDPELPELTKDGYRKWDHTPSGKRVLVGSTGQLTRKGFTRYLTQVEAFGADLGVQFHTVRMAA